MGEAYRRLDPGLRRMFTSRGASPTEAEDLSQQTWSVVWQAVREGRYDPGRGALGTFLYAVALKMWLRRRREAARAPDAVDDLADRVLSDRTDVGDAVALAELLGRVKACMAGDGVSADERRVLEALSRGVSDRELSRELGVAPSTAHARKASVLDRVRRLIFPGRSAAEPPGGPERRAAGREEQGAGGLP